MNQPTIVSHHLNTTPSESDVYLWLETQFMDNQPLTQLSRCHMKYDQQTGNGKRFVGKKFNHTPIFTYR